MKKFVLITGMIFAFLAATAQGRYYTLVECGTDPLRYIEKNYEDNAVRYKGKTVAQFVQECELAIEDFVPMVYYLCEANYDPNNGKIEGVRFYFYFDDYRYSVPLWFSPPYTHTIDDFHNLEDNRTTEVWKDLYYQFFKDYVIDDMWVLKRMNGKTIKNYRRP